MKTIITAMLALWCGTALAADTVAAGDASTNARPDYVLVADDFVHVKVYQEDDLDAKVRISKDGTIVLALLGPVKVGGKTRESAARHVRDLLGEKYLVNPQVTLEVVEYSKRRFTVMGQVERRGTYHIPGDESVNLLQAISMAGGYNRLGTGRGVTVQRGNEVIKLNADSNGKTF
ncbi:MAG TPA: polysaccharide biosynthesis/export family protein, partial [Methylomirabilota bacterium]|nr:polysaccharide biosynthesis/export family protein [Methylomirabilota bacterium]